MNDTHTLPLSDTDINFISNSHVKSYDIMKQQLLFFIYVKVFIRVLTPIVKAL